MHRNGAYVNRAQQERSIFASVTETSIARLAHCRNRSRVKLQFISRSNDKPKGLLTIDSSSQNLRGVIGMI